MWFQQCRQRHHPAVPKAPSYSILTGGEILNHTGGEAIRTINRQKLFHFVHQVSVSEPAFSSEKKVLSFGVQ